MNEIYTRRRLTLIIVGAFLPALVEVDEDFGESLNAHEAVNFQHSYLEVSGCAQRWVVEGFAGVSLAISNVFVHPNCLTIAKIQRKF